MCQSAREVRAKLHDKDQTQEAALTLSHNSWGHFSRNKFKEEGFTGHKQQTACMNIED